MNIQSKINKLLMALRVKGRYLRIDTEQFPSNDMERMITKYIVYETHPRQGEIFYSKVNMEVGGADG